MPTRFHIRLYGCLFALMLTATPAVAQRVVAVANTLSATRQAAALHAHEVDFTAPDGQAVGPAQRLPGVVLSGPLIAHPSRPQAVASTRFAPPFGIFPDFFASFVPLLQTTPVLHDRSRLIQSDAHQELRAACFVATRRGRPLLAVLASANTEHALHVYDLEDGARLHARWPLPGRPLLAKALPDGVVAVLCRMPDGAAAVHMRRAATGETLAEAVAFPLTSLTPGNHPAAAAVAPDLGVMAVAVSGYSFDTPLGTPETHIFLLDIQTLRVLNRVRAPGLAAPNGLARHGDAFWVATHTPSDSFAYVGRYEIVRGELRLDNQYSFGGATSPPLVAPAPHSPAVAIAIGDSLEVWASGRPGPPPRRFGQPIGALRWADGNLIAAEADRLHLLSGAGLVSRRVLHLLSGVVADILVLPPEPPEAPQVRPRMDALRLDLPYIRLFSAAAAGRELHTAVVASEIPATSWRLDPETIPPWLLVQPQAGERLPAVLHLMVNPSRYGDPAESRGARLALLAAGVDETGGVVEERAEMAVHVLPQSSPLHRILWIWDAPLDASFRDPADPLQLRTLAETLAAPPHLFIHEETSIPVLTPLGEYKVVVLTASAAAAGAVTRQAVLEYVANGGALLILGEHLPDPARPLTPWLSPLGITIDAGTAVSGQFDAHEEHPIARNWSNFEIADGAYLRSSRPETILVPGPDPERGDAVLIAQEYGYGRLAALAAPTPLQTAAMSRIDNRLFAADLFRWLARAGRDVRDLSQDGLLQWIEDARQPESLATAAPDDADLTAMPAPGPPRLAAVTPDTGPAEGGTLVALSGDALSLDAQVWFGERSAQVRPDAQGRPNTVLAETPPSPSLAPGPVDVRIVSLRSGLETHLPAAFEYGPRSTVTARLAAVEHVQTTAGFYEGDLTLTIAWPLEAQIDAIEITLVSEPADAVQWTRIALQENESAKLIVRNSLDTDLPLLLTDIEQANGQLIVELDWRIPQADAHTPASVNLLQFRPHTPGGVALAVDARPQRLFLAGTPPTPRRAGTD